MGRDLPLWHSMHLVSVQDRWYEPHRAPGRPGRRTPHEGGPMESNAPENQAAEADDRAQDVDVAESLIEEVSIDGMCGVY
ncbi:mycofactocin precursor [Actinomadura montaniterrae]|uniref:Mycofactocin n=1 Tax=Actinomadura montaniterrae TaxID=1803903 RepID=A0A6L3VVF7_9ACTN|nr:mycofactocin precursor [Actinomadura montaniterrae]